MRKAGFGSGESRPILLDNVACDGSEENINQCDYDTVTNCDHSEDAGVICGGIYRSSYVQHIEHIDHFLLHYSPVHSMQVNKLLQAC